MSLVSQEEANRKNDVVERIFREGAYEPYGPGARVFFNKPKRESPLRLWGVVAVCVFVVFGLAAGHAALFEFVKELWNMLEH